MQPREGGCKKATSASGTLYFSAFHDIYKENTTMRYLKKYYDESGFTEPVEVVEKKIGIYLPGMKAIDFYEAVDNGDGTYSVDAQGQHLLFEDGFGFYSMDESGNLVKLTLGDAISGTMQSMFGAGETTYTGYMILNSSDFACIACPDDVKQWLGTDYWFGFTAYPPEPSAFSEKGVVRFDEFSISETRQNEIHETPDIYLVNYPSSHNSALSMDATNNGDGTYTTKRGGITYSSGDGVCATSGNTAYKMNIGTEPIVFYTGSFGHTGYTYTCPGYGCPTGFCAIADELGAGYIYSLYSGTTESAKRLQDSAYRTNITHPYKEKSEYVVKVVKPGVGYISGKKKVGYNQPKSYASAVTLTISGTSDYACTIPMNGNVLSITQEELRKIAVRFIPNATGNGEWSECKILFSGITSYAINTDSRSVYGSSISASKSGSNLTITFGAYDMPNCRNDVLIITFPESTATGMIKTYYTGAQ